MSAPKPTAVNTRSPTIKRILREAAELSASPSPDFAAQPLESDLFEWHFTLKGPPNSVYSEGRYHGRIVLPPTYPLRPPMFRFSTPNGRFEANREICLSISGHHEETWQPAWGIRTAIVALRSFMETEAHGQLGGLETTDEARKKFADESKNWRCPTCQITNAEIINDSEIQSQQSPESKGDTDVPQELKMRWKDELISSPGTAREKHTANEDAGLAEGFVQTASPGEATASELCTTESPPQSETRQTRTSDNDAASIQQTSCQANNSVPANSLERPNDDDGAPLWIDRAIVVLLIALFALLVKVLFGI